MAWHQFGGKNEKSEANKPQKIDRFVTKYPGQGNGKISFRIDYYETNLEVPKVEGMEEAGEELRINAMISPPFVSTIGYAVLANDWYLSLGLIPIPRFGGFYFKNNPVPTTWTDYYWTDYYWTNPEDPNQPPDWVNDPPFVFDPEPLPVFDPIIPSFNLAPPLVFDPNFPPVFDPTTPSFDSTPPPVFDPDFPSLYDPNLPPVLDPTIPSFDSTPPPVLDPTIPSPYDPNLPPVFDPDSPNQPPDWENDFPLVLDPDSPNQPPDWEDGLLPVLDPDSPNQPLDWEDDLPTVSEPDFPRNPNNPDLVVPDEGVDETPEETEMPYFTINADPGRIRVDGEDTLGFTVSMVTELGQPLAVEHPIDVLLQVSGDAVEGQHYSFMEDYGGDKFSVNFSPGVTEKTILIQPIKQEARLSKRKAITLSIVPSNYYTEDKQPGDEIE